MEYRQIISVTGLGGLFQLINTKNDGAIVKRLEDGSVRFVSARVHQITPLESIEIYTHEGNVRLHEVFEKMKENDDQVATLNSKKEVSAAREYFKSVLPEYDEERVYASDIRKILKWYGILKDKDLLHFDYLNEETDGAEGETQDQETEETAPDKASEKKTAKAKATKVTQAEKKSGQDADNRKKTNEKNTANTGKKAVAQPASKGAKTAKNPEK